MVHRGGGAGIGGGAIGGGRAVYRHQFWSYDNNACHMTCIDVIWRRWRMKRSSKEEDCILDTQKEEDSNIDTQEEEQEKVLSYKF